MGAGTEVCQDSPEAAGSSALRDAKTIRRRLQRNRFRNQSVFCNRQVAGDFRDKLRANRVRRSRKGRFRDGNGPQQNQGPVVPFSCPTRKAPNKSSRPLKGPTTIGSPAAPKLNHTPPQHFLPPSLQ